MSTRQKILSSKIFWVYIFFFMIAIGSRCIFDTSGIASGVYISSSPPPNGCIGESYSFQFVASGGDKPYTWDIPLPFLPPIGLTLGPKTGILSGAPITKGKYTFQVQVTDSKKKNYREEYTLSISDFNITNAIKTIYYCVGETIDFKLITCGGTPLFTWGLKAGSKLPSGVSLKPDGRIYGKTSAAGGYAFTVVVKDSTSPTPKQAEKDFKLSSSTALKILSKATLPGGKTSVAYTLFQLEACGGKTSYTWSNPDGKLPSGLKLSPGGLISGTPTLAADYTFKVEVKDNDKPPNTSSKNMAMKISPSALAIASTSPLPYANECNPYSYTFQGSGGTGKYTWKQTAGQLPKGLSLNTFLGILSGTPPVPSPIPYSFTIELSDGITKITKAFDLTVKEDATVSSGLKILPLQGNVKNSISLSSTVILRIAFQFPGNVALLTQPTPDARLQVVGECTKISKFDFIGPLDLDGDGKLEMIARFDIPKVLGLLASAGKKAGDQATLRFWIDVNIDSVTKKTYIQKAHVTITN